VFDRGNTGVDHNASTAGSRAPQIPLVQAMNIDFHRMRFDECAGDVVCPQNGHFRQSFCRFNFRDTWDQGARLIELLPQQRQLVGACYGDHGLRGQQSMFAKAGGWRTEKPAARDGETTYHRVAVIFREACSRAPGRMIPAVGLALEQDNGRKCGDFISRSGPGDTAAHDKNVCSARHRRQYARGGVQL
jgi:hypothetical protein